MIEASLVDSANLALSGDREAVRSFFQLFLRSSLVVPRRTQAFQLSHNPSYPNEIFDYLGIQATERVFIPVFSEKRYLSEWSTQSLDCREVSGQRLVEVIPDDWWIGFNPGSEVNKEISAWEIQQLRHGDKGIEAILNEIDFGLLEDITVEPLLAQEHQKLKQALSDIAETNSEVQTLHLIRLRGKGIDGNENTLLKIGAEIRSSSKEKLAQIEELLRDAAERSTIGDERADILVGVDKSGVALGLFKDFAPFFSRETKDGFLRKIRKTLKW